MSRILIPLARNIARIFGEKLSPKVRPMPPNDPRHTASPRAQPFNGAARVSHVAPALAPRTRAEDDAHGSVHPQIAKERSAMQYQRALRDEARRSPRAAVPDVQQDYGTFAGVRHGAAPSGFDANAVSDWSPWRAPADSGSVPFHVLSEQEARNNLKTQAENLLKKGPPTPEGAWPQDFWQKNRSELVKVASSLAAYMDACKAHQQEPAADALALVRQLGGEIRKAFEQGQFPIEDWANQRAALENLGRMCSAAGFEAGAVAIKGILNMGVSASRPTP